MSKYRARKTTCQNGHTHDSAREARRCAELHLLYRAGQIDALVYAQTFHLTDGGKPLKMRNGQQAKYTVDFTYLENGKVVCEDVKGFIVRDFPLRAALFKSNNPDIELRVVT